MREYLYKFSAMSTPCEVRLFSAKKSKADAVAKAILEEAKRLEKKYNYYAPNSFLSALNERRENVLDTESQSLLQRAKHYYETTEGIFDITTATFKPLFSQNLSLKLLQSEKEKLLAFVGCEHYRIKKGKLYFDNAFTKIDLGGFVKEYSVDRAVTLLKRAKITAALVNFGGDIYVLGEKPNGEKFKIGIKDPVEREKHCRFIELSDAALTTSASYERNYQIEGHTFSHILAKKTVHDAPASVTVIAPNCVESGVFSTALMVNPALKQPHRSIIL